jgi:hypothetical protein
VFADGAFPAPDAPRAHTAATAAGRTPASAPVAGTDRH